jgi:hypothetical protein
MLLLLLLLLLLLHPSRLHRGLDDRRTTALVLM